KICDVACGEIVNTDKNGFLGGVEETLSDGEGGIRRGICSDFSADADLRHSHVLVMFEAAAARDHFEGGFERALVVSRVEAFRRGGAGGDDHGHGFTPV